MHHNNIPRDRPESRFESEPINLDRFTPEGLFSDGDSGLYLVAVAAQHKAAIVLADPLDRSFALHELTDEPIADGFSLGPVDLRLNSALQDGWLYLEQTGIILIDELQVSITCGRADSTLTSLPIGISRPAHGQLHSAFDGWTLEDPVSHEVLFARCPGERLTAAATTWHRPSSIHEVYFDLPA